MTLPETKQDRSWTLSQYECEVCGKECFAKTTWLDGSHYLCRTHAQLLHSAARPHHELRRAWVVAQSVREASIRAGDIEATETWARSVYDITEKAESIMAALIADMKETDDARED